MRRWPLAAALLALAGGPAWSDGAADLAGCRDTAAPEAQAAACGRLVAAGALAPVEMARVLNSRGEARLKLGDLDGAAADFARALALAPGFHLAQHNVGVLEALRGDLRAAEAAYGRALGLVPDPEAGPLGLAASHRNRAEVRLALCNWEGVIADVTAALVHSDAYSDPVSGWKTEMFLWRGIAFARLGRMDEAITDFNSHAAIWPETTQVYLERGRAFVAVGLLHAARADLDGYNAAEPDSPEALVLLGQVEARLGDPARAAALFDMAEAAGGRDPALWQGRAAALCALGRGPEAEADWLAYWAKAPEAAEAEQARLAAAGHFGGPRDGTYSDALRAALAAYVAAECRAP